jgi:hypothetical protein
MSRCWTLAFVVLTACVGASHTRTGYAADPIYHDEIQACLDRVDCAQLCVDVFKLDPSDDVERVKIITHDQYGAKLACQFSGSTGDFSLDVSFDDWGDDECDGDCGDDGADTGSDDGSDTGSDDGSDSGSDDSGSDDGGPTTRIAPHQVHIAPTAATPRQ